MGITIMTLAFVGLVAVVVTATMLTRTGRRATTTRGVKPWVSSARPASVGWTDWFASDPVLFVGLDAAAADRGAARDVEGAGRD